MRRTSRVTKKGEGIKLEDRGHLFSFEDANYSVAWAYSNREKVSNLHICLNLKDDICVYVCGGKGGRGEGVLNRTGRISGYGYPPSLPSVKNPKTKP
jgi:hypothetical protein